MENLFEFPYLLKLKDNKGILFGFKNAAARNYIDVSPYFSKVYFANFNNANYSKTTALKTFSLQKVTQDMKVLFHGSDRLGQSFYNEEPSEEYFSSVTYFIVGELI